MPLLPALLAGALASRAQGARLVSDPWFGHLRAESLRGDWPHASVVLVAEDPRDVTTMFGHVFLVLHRNEEPEPDAIVVEYVGEMRASGGGVLRALFAHVPGTLVLSRFLVKTNEYDRRGRSLWMYRLSPDKVPASVISDRLLAGAGDFAYGFFARNCASSMFQLITGEMGAGLRRMWATPAQMVGDLADGHLFSRVFYRPSPHDRFVAAQAPLRGFERRQIAKWVAGRRPSIAAKTPETYLVDARLRLAAHEQANEKFMAARDAAERDRLMAVKKVLGPKPSAHPRPPPDPAQARRTSMLQTSLTGPHLGMRLEGRIAAYDFLSAPRGPLDLSTLELGRGHVEVGERSSDPVGLTLIDLESHAAGHGQRRTASRYLYAGYLRQEIRLRLGIGGALAFGRAGKGGLIVFSGPGAPGGPRHFHFAWAVGARALFRPALPAPFRLRCLFEVTYWFPGGLREEVDIAMVPWEWSRGSIAVGVRFSRLSLAALEGRVGVNRFF